MTGELVICVDMGTTRIKGGAVRADGGMEATAEAPAPILEDWRGFASFDPLGLRDRVIDILRRIAAALPDPGRVRAVALTGQRATIVPVRGDGTPAGPALSWQDTSGAGDLDSMLVELGRDRFTEITCLPPSALWSLAKILRLRRQVPEVFRSTACFALLHDFILHGLGSDGFVTDPSNASVTGLLDLGTRRWSGEILTAAGLHETQLPRIAPPGAVCGALSSEAARATGLPGSTPLVVGGGDQQCAALGIGAFARGEAALCLGTAAVLSCPVEEPMPGAAARFFSTSHVSGDLFVLEGIHNAFAACLNWAGTAMGAGTARARTLSLRRSPPGANGVRFLPFLSGIGSPDYDAASAGTFLGLRLTHTKADLVRSVYEGVMLETRRMIDAVGELSTVGRILIGGVLGGGTAGQLLADVLGTEIEVTRTREISLTGVAALAWTGAGRFASIREAASTLSGRRFRTVRPLDPHAYDGLFGQYVRDVRGVRNLYPGGGT